MRVQGYLDRFGKIVLAQVPSKIKEGTPVWVEIPDDIFLQANNTPEDTETESVLSERAKNTLQQLQETREKSLRKASKTELTKKEQERWEAFELRSKLREEQGRPE